MNKYNLFLNMNFSGNSTAKYNRKSIKIKSISGDPTKYLIGSGFISKRVGNITYRARTMREIRDITMNHSLFKDESINYKVGIIPKSI